MKKRFEECLDEPTKSKASSKLCVSDVEKFVQKAEI